MVLLVEDNEADAELTADLLAPHVATERIVHAATLRDAIACRTVRVFDVVLLDLRLPDATGLACVQAIRLSAPEAAIVVLTGINDDELAVRCIRAGAQDHLSKRELTTESLRRSIGYALARAGQQAARHEAAVAHARLAAIVNGSSDAIVSSDANGNIISWNHGAELVFGYREVEALGRPIGELLHGAHEGDQPGALSTLAEAHAPARAELVWLRGDGTAITLSVVSSMLRDPAGSIVGLALICRDITEAKRHEAELRGKTADLVVREHELRALATRLDQIREDERTRISREVHDELGQLLTSLKMDLRWATRKLAGSSLLDVVGPRLDEAQASIDRTIETVQRIALELRPSALDALGLAAAIRDESRRFSRRTNIAASVEVDTREEPERSIATQLFRMFQELLTNVARHAHAHNVRVGLLGSDDAWTLRVADDGIGISPTAHHDGASLGLIGLRERARYLGGTVTLRRGEGGARGTVATIHIPRHGGTGADAIRTDRG